MTFAELVVQACSVDPEHSVSVTVQFWRHKHPGCVNSDLKYWIFAADLGKLFIGQTPEEVLEKYRAAVAAPAPIQPELVGSIAPEAIIPADQFFVRSSDPDVCARCGCGLNEHDCETSSGSPIEADGVPCCPPVEVE